MIKAVNKEELDLIEQFKKGMDPDSAMMLAERLKALEQENEQLKEKLGGNYDHAVEHVQKLEQKISELETRPSTDELNEKLARIEADRDAHAARADKAEAAAKEAPKRVTQKEAGPKARNLKPMYNLIEKSKEQRDAFHAALLAEIRDADTVEIAFSDGKKEITELGTHLVEGTVWKGSLHGLAMTVPVELRGAGSNVVVEGYALLLDGKAAAYTRLDTPLTVQSGAHVRVDDIHF